jgi:hypothetical protein
MKRPLWTHPLFAGFVAVDLLVLATLSMKRAVLYARFKVSPLDRLQPDNTLAVIFLIGSMVLVVAAIVVPLIIRKNAHAFLKRALMKSIGVVALLLAAAPAADAQPRYDEAGKRRVVELTRTLEKNPLGDKDKRQRTELLEWWVSGPVRLEWCSELLVDAANDKTKPLVVTQGMFGAGARLLESSKPLSPIELATAGVESALVAYKSALRADRAYADKLMDELAADAAKQKAYVARHVEHCAKPKK